MITFYVYGKEADFVRKALGHACFLSGFEVQDFFVDIGYVKVDKKPILSREITEPDFLLVLDRDMKDFKIKDSLIAVMNSPNKVAFKKKVKCHYVDADKIANELKAKQSIIMLGAITKIFDKISLRNMKEAIIGEGEEPLSLEEGYKAVR